MDNTKKAWTNALFLLVTLILNTVSALGLINGLTQKEISDRYITLITPSPATFSIWSIIYSSLILSILFMIIRKKDSYYQRAIEEISVLFWISCLFNIAWILTFAFVLIEISVVFIVGFVITLSLINQKLLKIQEKKNWLLPLSFGLYSGWLFIATVVNLSAALVKMNWGRFGIAEEIWGVVIVIIAVLLIIAVQFINRNAVFPLPIAWALWGINQFLKAPEGFGGQYPLLQTVSLIGAVVLIGAAAIRLYLNHFSLLPTSKKA